MVTIVRIDAPDDAQRDLFDAWAEVFLASARSILGEDHTARPVAELRALGHSPDRRRTVLAAVEGDMVVGGIGIVLPLHDNLAVAMVNLAVHPGHLRRGVGTALLAAGESVAREQGRTVLLAETQWPVGGRDDSGEGFAARHGYAAAQTTLRSALSLPADAGRLGALLAGDGADGYVTRTCWDGIPEQWLEGRAELSRRMSTDIPLGEMQLEEEVWDADRVRGDYRQVATLGRRVVDTFAVEVATGELVGWTQVQVPQDLPGVAFQHDTLVLREHRGHGLGLRVKAASTLSLMQESPETTRVRTWNADDNAPMLAVNDAVGYVRDAHLREWQKILPVG